MIPWVEDENEWLRASNAAARFAAIRPCSSKNPCSTTRWTAAKWWTSITPARSCASSRTVHRAASTSAFTRRKSRCRSARGKRLAMHNSAAGDSERVRVAGRSATAPTRRTDRRPQRLQLRHRQVQQHPRNPAHPWSNRWYKPKNPKARNRLKGKHARVCKRFKPWEVSSLEVSACGNATHQLASTARHSKRHNFLDE